MQFLAEPRVLQNERRTFLRPQGASKEDEKEELLFSIITKRYYKLLHSPIGTSQKTTYDENRVPRLLIHLTVTQDGLGIRNEASIVTLARLGSWYRHSVPSHIRMPSLVTLD